MEIEQLVKGLEQTKGFMEWRKGRDAFLAHILLIDNKISFGYYDKSKKQMYVVEGDNIVSSEILETGAKIEKLCYKKAISFEKATEIAEKILADGYPNEKATKAIAVLQQIKGKPAYSITFLTASIKTINIKIDAETGAVASHDMAALIAQI